jgi:hypothetical protein
MIYKLYYLNNNNNKMVRNVDDIHPYNVWQVSQLWGIALAVVLESDPQPADAADYEEVIE